VCSSDLHIVLSQTGDCPNLAGQVPIFISPRNRVAPVIPPGTGFPFRRLLRLVGLRWRYSNPPPRGADTDNTVQYVFILTVKLYAAVRVTQWIFGDALVRTEVRRTHGPDRQLHVYFIGVVKQHWLIPATCEQQYNNILGNFLLLQQASIPTTAFISVSTNFI
jgi:hypothetical protein